MGIVGEADGGTVLGDAVGDVVGDTVHSGPLVILKRT